MLKKQRFEFDLSLERRYYQLHSAHFLSPTTERGHSHAGAWTEPWCEESPRVLSFTAGRALPVAPSAAALEAAPTSPLSACLIHSLLGTEDISVPPQSAVSCS